MVTVVVSQHIPTYGGFNLCPRPPATAAAPEPAAVAAVARREWEG